MKAAGMAVIDVGRRLYRIGSRVRRSLLFPTYTSSYCRIDDSVVFPQVDIRRHCRIRRAVIDRRCMVPPGTTIGYDHAEDARRFNVHPRVWFW
jgi:glucose-1-phosphate adenylyltransferase